MSIFLCPVCGALVEKTGSRYVCAGGHSFDRAKEGYVNLLPANKKHSKQPGDDKDMVRARNRFLSSGYYSALKQALEKCSSDCSKEACTVLDCGCGEGYYTEGILNSLQRSGKEVSLAGIDISKEAVRLAAKRCPQEEFAVASAYHLPVISRSIDLLINCFSPLCENEFLRVLKTGGYFIYVVPAPRHLWELKCALYDAPYENERIIAEYEGFDLTETRNVATKIFLEDNQIILDLFTMTPYFWKTSAGGKKRLEQLDCLETEISFDIHIYRKKQGAAAM